ncbi:hypothetical protein GCM10010254_68190 [Streptomyces chromofuscus]|nr:hypothetical protein GCM10010254_68190 [Streptomyces chromofuscus]
MSDTIQTIAAVGRPPPRAGLLSLRQTAAVRRPSRGFWSPRGGGRPFDASPGQAGRRPCSPRLSEGHRQSTDGDGLVHDHQDGRSDRRPARLPPGLGAIEAPLPAVLRERLDALCPEVPRATELDERVPDRGGAWVADAIDGTVLNLQGLPQFWST